MRKAGSKQADRLLGELNRALLAQLAPLGALLLQWLLWPIVSPQLWLFFYPAVFLSSWIGGLAGGLLATAVSTAMAWFVFAAPGASLWKLAPREYVSAAVFVLTGTFFSLFQERFRQTKKRAAELLVAANSAQQLAEEQVRERTAGLLQSNELLRVSQERLHLLMEGVKDYAIFMLDPEGRVSTWNDGASRIKGYQSAEIVGSHFSCFFSAEEQIAGRPDQILQLAVTLGRFEEDGLRVRRDGSTFWANIVITPIYDKTGKLHGFSKVTRDITLQKKTEQELRILAAVAQNSTDFIAIFTPDLESVFLNEAGLRTVGLDCSDDVRDTPLLQYFWPEDRAVFERDTLPILLRTGSWCGEIRLRHFKNGEPISTVLDIFAIHDEKGDTTGYATICPNLARLKQLQTWLTESDKRLRESQTRQAGIISSAMDAIITVDSEQRILVFNAAAEKVFLCPAAEALGQSIARFIPKNFRESHPDHIRRFTETGVTNRSMGARSSIWAVRTNGEEFPIEASISQMEAEGKKFFTVIIRDITARIRSEDALRQSDAIRKFALEAAQLGEWVLDLRTGTSERSALHDRIFGYTAKLEEWNYEIFLRHIHPDDRERVGKFLRRPVAAGEKWDTECRIIWPDHSIHWIWACGGMYYDKSGTASHAYSTVADITDRKRAAEMQLRSQKLEGLGTLAGGIAHDFNNILMAIVGNTKLAVADLPPDHPAQQSLAEIGKAGTRASDLVRRILAFSRSEEMKRDVLHLQPIVEEALKLVRATLPSTIQFRTRFAADLRAIVADSSQIHQVIVNLATNAAHAIGANNGWIEFQIDKVNIDSEAASERTGPPQGEYIELMVSDSGCGMDRGTLERIFDPFFTTKGPGEGTGLGLSVVHGIVTNHGGTIRVYSDPGKGTSFHLYFPAVGDTVAASLEPASKLPRERREHIMYVDDEEGLVLLTTRMLKRLGYKVTGFTDAGVALKEFRAAPSGFDAVVTDLAMPRMSGFEFARELFVIRADVPVIMTSGYLRPEDQERAQSMGFRNFIQKPQNIDQLDEALDLIFSPSAELTKPGIL